MSLFYKRNCPICMLFVEYSLLFEIFFIAYRFSHLPDFEVEKRIDQIHVEYHLLRAFHVSKRMQMDRWKPVTSVPALPWRVSGDAVRRDPK